MAFESNNKGNTRSAPGTNAGGDNYTKASGFMNFYLVQPNGGKVKIGAEPYYKHNPRHAQIMEYLLPVGADEAETLKLRADRLQKFLNTITISFVEVPDEPKKLELPL